MSSISSGSPIPTRPLSVITVSAEGAVTYKAMLFIPSKANGRYYTEDYESGCSCTPPA